VIQQSRILHMGFGNKCIAPVGQSLTPTGVSYQQNALYCDGNTHVSLPNFSLPSYADNTITVHALINFAGWLGGTLGLIQLAPNANAGVRIDVYTTGQVDLVRQGNSTTPTGVFLTEGKWHSLTAIINASRMMLYLDGQYRWEYGSGSTNADGSGIFIGHGYVGNSPFRGLIKEVSIWSRQLTEPEIMGLANLIIKDKANV